MQGVPIRLTLAAFALAMASAAQASTWQALSGHFQADPGNNNSDDYVFGGDYFEDGKYSPEQRTEVLVNTLPSRSVSIGFHYFNNGDPQDQAPQIDLAGMRADFSSLFWLGWRPDGEPAIGGNYGRPGWVPITDNHDGTYSATWRVSPDDFFNGPGIFSMTFAAAVPEPATPAYLLGGLAALGLFIRRRRPD